MVVWMLLCVTGGIDFDTEVLPVLSKAGCNAAACHGAATGRANFKLSLFAGDPAADHAAIARDRKARRIHFTSPLDSLLLAKPTGGLAHEGGVRFEADSEEARLLAKWIAEGARRDARWKVVKLEVDPVQWRAEHRLPSTVPVIVWATLENTATREVKRQDVTRWAILTADDPDAVEVTPEQHLLLTRPGRQHVVVRYLTHVQTITLLAPLGPPADAPPPTASPHVVDHRLHENFVALRLKPVSLADDYTLVRRLHLDLIGRLPTPQVAQAYVARQSPEKYAQLVDKLLASSEFTDYWTYRLGRQLRLTALAGDAPAAEAFHAWLKLQLENGTPWDQLCRELLTASGDSHQHGAAGFHRAASDARLEAELVSEALLGVRLRCANCHNHPLDKWTQDDYHGLAAIFARVERSRIVAWKPLGEVIHPATSEAARPRLPDDRFLASDEDPAQVFANWATAPENPLFAKAMVNRLWAALFGRGLVEPLDDLRATNPGLAPNLHAQLAERFANSNYDLRALLRVMLLSAAYRRGEGLGLDPDRQRFFAQATARPLTAEVWLDAIGDVTGVPEKFAGAREGIRAVELVNARLPSPALDALGRCQRAEDCASGENSAGGLWQQLTLFNSELLNKRLADPAGHLAQALAAKKSNAEIVSEFYWRAYSRPPRAAEAQHWEKQLATEDAAQRQAKLEDFVWALLMSREFQTNH